MKIRIMFLVTISILLLSSCTTTDEYAMSSVYTIKHEEIKDIRGDFSVDNFLLYKDIWKVGGKYLVIVKRYTFQDNKIRYMISNQYDGMGWEFIEGIIIKTDDNVYDLKDNDPNRTIISGSRVIEIANCDLPDNIVSDIQYSKKLMIQYTFNNPVDIPDEGISRLKIFLESK